MEDTPALYHCNRPLCEDEIAQPANKFWKCHIKAFRARRVPLYCRRCFFDLKFERIAHDLPTRFDRELARLGLTGQDYKAWAESQTLRAWAAKHASSCYVPEKLLSTWRMREALARQLNGGS
jgi:hypothetical protein